MKKPIEQYFGTYVGISPTDESKIAMGEMELILSSSEFKMRFATGLKVMTEGEYVSHYKPLTEEELKAQFDDSSQEPQRVSGFRVGDDGVILLFYSDIKEGEFRLVVRLGEMSEILGPTMLFDAIQVAKGDFDRLLQKIESEVGPYPVPRLMYDGLHEPQQKT